MREIIGNIVDVLIYSILFIFILIISLKIIGSSFSQNFERELIEERNLPLSIVLSSVSIGIAILFLSIIR